MSVSGMSVVSDLEMSVLSGQGISVVCDLGIGVMSDLRKSVMTRKAEEKSLEAQMKWWKTVC